MITAYNTVTKFNSAAEAEADFRSYIEKFMVTTFGAEVFELLDSQRRESWYDPETGKLELIMHITNTDALQPAFALGMQFVVSPFGDWTVTSVLANH